MDISVIIPAYDDVDRLAKAVDSVIAQRVGVEEIIVIDDGSNDATSEVAKQYEDVLLLRQKHMGTASALNNGIMMASSTWMAFLDPADSWGPDKLARQIERHAQEPALAASVIDERSKDDGEIPLLGFSDVITSCEVPSSSLLVKKELLERIGLFDESFEACVEYDLLLRVLGEERVASIDANVIDRTSRHDRNAHERYWIKALEKHLDGVYDQIVRKELIVIYRAQLLDARREKRREEEALCLLRLEHLEAGY